MHPSQIVAYYSRDDVSSVIAKTASGREAVGSFGGQGYDARPGVIQYPSDVAALARKGITSFHISVEHWKFPMQLSVEKNYDNLRSGWDLIIDMDSKTGLDAAKIAALAACEFLEQHGVSGYGIKFSGSRGFHLCIPWSAFPKEVDFKETAKQYPEISRIIIDYMKEKVRKTLMEKFREQLPASTISEAAAFGDPYKIVEIEKEWGPRHLFRSPYSLNEKTWLVSMPLTKQELRNFNAEYAKPENMKAERNFFPEKSDAEKLLVKALDWHGMRKKIQEKPAAIRRGAGERMAAPEKFFPPCMKLILAGLKDGKRRSLFSLISFLRGVGWDWPEIEALIAEWNLKNDKPIPKTYISGEINRHKQLNKNMNPANCFNEHFYVSIGVCQPDGTCKLIKNPMNYPFKKMVQLRKLEPRSKEKEPIYACDMCEKKYSTMQVLHGHRTRFHQARF